MVTLRVFTTRRLIRCTRFDGSCLRIFAAKCSTEKIGQYGFALGFKLSRERSKKTEAVFLVGSRESEGKSKSPQALFLLPAFSFGEAKENADGQLQICTVYQPFERLLETPEASPMRGSCRRRRLMRWGQLRRRRSVHLIRHGSAVPPSPRRGRHGAAPAQKKRPSRSGRALGMGAYSV